MQFKTLGESLNVLNIIQSISSNVSLNSAEKFEQLTTSLSSYSVEVLKSALSQEELSEKQIKAILIAKGYKGELLQTTAEELLNAKATSALSKSQSTATASTLGLGNAFKGLGVSIKNTATSMKVFLTGTPLGWLTIAASVVAGLAVAYDAWNTSLDEQKEKLEESEEAFANAKSELQSVENELQSTQDRIDELNETPNPSFVEQAELWY